MSGGCFDDFRLGSSWERMLPSMVHPTSTVTVLFCVRLEDPSVKLQILCFLLVSMLLFFLGGGFFFLLSFVWPLFWLYWFVYIVWTRGQAFLSCLSSILRISYLKTLVDIYYSLITLVYTLLDVREAIISHSQFRVKEVEWILVHGIEKKRGTKEVLMLSPVISWVF